MVGAFLGGYIILYGQVQSWTPQLITGPLKQTPPNKMTEVFWGLVNVYPTLIAAIVFYARSVRLFRLVGLSASVLQVTPLSLHAHSDVFINYYLPGMITWLLVIIISFAVIFAINSSIHSFLVVKYAASDKVAVSVGVYYMSNALGRLTGTLGSGFIYTYAGEEITSASGYFAGTDARIGLAACFVAGTVSSLLAALITLKIKDDDGGLMCGGCTIIDDTKVLEEGTDFDESGQQAQP